MSQSFLHNLPHLDHSLERVSNDIVIPDAIDDIFTSTENSYLQSIQMFAYIPILFGAVYVIICIAILSMYYCCGMCRSMFSYGKTSSNAKEVDNYLLFHQRNAINADADENNIELTAYSKWIRITFAWFVAITIIICTVYGTSFNRSLIYISDNWSTSYYDYQSIIHNAHKIYKDYIPSAQRECESILNTASAQPLWQNITQMNEMLNQFLFELNQFLSASENIPNWSVIGSDIKPYREWVVIFPLIILVIFGMMMILNHLCFAHDYLNNKSCCCCCSISVLFGGFLIFILVSVQFAISIFIADGCDDPNHTLWQVVDAHIYKEDVPTIKYYIFCAENNTIHNPLYTMFDASYSDLNALNQSIYALNQNALKYDIESEANALYNDYYLSLELMAQINNTLQCDTISRYKQNMANELCGDALQYWMIYYMLQCLCILLVVVRSWCICTENKQDYDAQNGCSDKASDYGTNKTEMALSSRLSSISDALLVVRVPKSPSPQSNGGGILITINSNQGRRTTQYRVDTTQFVYDLMEIIQMREGIDTAQQKLLYRGEQLLPDSMIADVLKNGDNIDLIVLNLSVSSDETY